MRHVIAKALGILIGLGASSPCYAQSAGEAARSTVSDAASAAADQAQDAAVDQARATLKEAGKELEQSAREAAPQTAAAVDDARAAAARAEAALLQAEAARAKAEGAAREMQRMPAQDGGNAGGTRAIALAQNAQSVGRKYLGLRTGPPSVGVIGSGPLFTGCGLLVRGRYVPGAAPYLTGACQYFFQPMALAAVALSPFFPTQGGAGELRGATTHHLTYNAYALDYEKKSALTGQAQRRTEGFGLGYDITYTYDHPKWGLMGYGNVTWQQSNIDKNEFVYITNYFTKLDAQAGLDFARLLATATGWEYLAWQRMYVRGGPSLFHDFIRMGDHGSTYRVAYVDQLNEGAPLVTGLGYEVAAEVDFRFPFDLGGVRFNFERGTYPSLNFADLTPREAALIALVEFEDLRAGDTYTWQKLKLEVEIPGVYTRRGGLAVAGQVFRYENNFGSGVNNRGLSLTYNWRWQ
jgi:hypothetical protein